MYTMPLSNLSYPRVAVIVASYNRLPLLKRCLDSISRQRTNFAFTIVVADDGSTDGTVEYLQYLSEINGISLVRILNKHIGIMKNFASALNYSVSQDYIAFCDCDDYWTDPNKLQRQVDYMDNNPRSTLCFTRCVVVNEDGETYPGYRIPKYKGYNNLLKNGYIPALTVMIRNSAYKKYARIEKFIKLGMNAWDYPIWLALVRKGTVGYSPNATAVYTKYIESYSNTRTRKNRLRIQSGVWWVKFYFMFRYGCYPTTFLYVLYRTARDIYSIIFKRWYRRNKV